MSVLCLHIAQAAMVYINTLMVQDVLRDPEWSAALSKTDYRALNPLFWAHVAMHGEFKLNMSTLLTLDPAIESATSAT
jgi:Tn3 transposase DDE domain